MCCGFRRQFINASICVLALIPLKNFSEKTSCDEFGTLVAARYRAVLEAEISPVPMRNAMGWFPSDHVIVAEAAIAIESRRQTCCEMMQLAQSEMRSELSDLYNLSGTQRRRLERKYDFMLETLRRKLAPYKANVSLTIRFPENIQFESESFAALETMSAHSLPVSKDR